MAIQSVVTTQTDFTGEFPLHNETVGLWRFNESQPNDGQLKDSSMNNHHFTISNWSGTSASLVVGKFGRFFRQNIVNPTSEKTYLTATNDGSFFTDLGEKIVIGGWINPTTYSIGQTFIPVFSTRNGPGQPILYISLYQGRLRLMLYNNVGTLIYDTSETPSISFVNNGWYFITTIINRTDKTIQNFIGDRSNGATWQSPVRNYTGVLNEECTADIVMGMLQDTYYYAGGFDDWFFERDSKLTIEDIHLHFKSSIQANGADSAAQVDALTGLDCHITPLQSMKAGSIKLWQGYGSHHMKFKAAANPDDTFSVLSSSRQVLRNQSKTEKEGFYQYTAASDSKHIVELEEGKGARVLFEFQEMQEGSDKQ